MRDRRATDWPWRGACILAGLVCVVTALPMAAGHFLSFYPAYGSRHAAGIALGDWPFMVAGMTGAALLAAMLVLAWWSGSRRRFELAVSVVLLWALWWIVVPALMQAREAGQRQPAAAAIEAGTYAAGRNTEDLQDLCDLYAAAAQSAFAVRKSSAPGDFGLGFALGFDRSRMGRRLAWKQRRR